MHEDKGGSHHPRLNRHTSRHPANGGPTFHHNAGKRATRRSYVNKPARLYPVKMRSVLVVKGEFPKGPARHGAIALLYQHVPMATTQGFPAFAI